MSEPAHIPSEIPHDQLPGSNRLFLDYIERFDRVREFYRWNPRDAAAPPALAAALAARAYPRAELARILAEQNARWGAGPAALRNAERLADPAALAVVTGQQTGLFGGPAFTLYKAATAAGTAAAYEAQLGRPVVPVFWMLSEDHDLPEADHVTLLDAGHRPTIVRLSIPESHGVRLPTPEGSAARPPGQGGDAFIPANLALGPAIAQALSEAAALLPDTEFKGDVLDELARCYAPEETLASAFARWMARLVREWGVVLLDAADPRLKALARPVLVGELERAPATSRAILEVSARLEGCGYRPQVVLREDGANVFWLDGGRWPIRRTAGGLCVQRGGDLVPLGTEGPDPAALSPNVALRPVVQDALLPTLAYIGGPAELAYFAQLGPAYAAFAVPMPLILPRAAFTLVEPRSLALLARHNLTLSDLRGEAETLVSSILRQDRAAAFEARLAEAQAALARTFKEVEGLVAEIDPTLKGPAAQAAGQARRQLEGLGKKVIQALKRRDDGLRAQVHRLREHLMPGGRPQERVLCPLPFLVKHGWGLLAAIRAAAATPGWTHRLLPLGPRDAGQG